ncbi:MAG TPA: hypothetical protein PKE31_15735 [Pseudomonadota bacterium]|jgi:hypothetical protein|nr:hypothetical protein [Pseudomonadota bacterium]
MKKLSAFALFGFVALLSACGPKAQMTGSGSSTIVPPTAPGVPSPPSVPTGVPTPPMNANPTAIPGVP